MIRSKIARRRVRIGCRGREGGWREWEMGKEGKGDMKGHLVS